VLSGLVAAVEGEEVVLTLDCSGVMVNPETGEGT